LKIQLGPRMQQFNITAMKVLFFSAVIYSTNSCGRQLDTKVNWMSF